MTTILASHVDPVSIASKNLQSNLNQSKTWLRKWHIKVNETSQHTSPLLWKGIPVYQPRLLIVSSHRSKTLNTLVYALTNALHGENAHSWNENVLVWNSDVLDYWKKITTYSGKENTYLQSHVETSLELWYPTLHFCWELQSYNLPKIQKQSDENHCLCSKICA